LAEIEDLKERLMSFDEYIKEKCSAPDIANLESESHDGDQHSLSFHEPLMHDHEEGIGDERSNEDTPTSIASSLEDKGLVCHFPNVPPRLWDGGTRGGTQKGDVW
jgi:hypothetical protein